MDNLIEYLRDAAENANLPQYMRDRLTEAAAALEAAREDAGRYRWLRDNPEHGFGGGAIVQVFTGHDAIEFLHSHALDAAIDQARGKAGQEVGK